MSRLLYQAELSRQGFSEKSEENFFHLIVIVIEPPNGIEPLTSSLPWKHSTDWARGALLREGEPTTTLEMGEIPPEFLG